MEVSDLLIIVQIVSFFGGIITISGAIPAIMIMINKPEFIIPISHSNHLKNGKINEIIKEEFNIKNHPLSNKHRMKKIKSKIWEIRPKGRMYKIKEKKEQINVYRKKNLIRSPIKSIFVIVLIGSVMLSMGVGINLGLEWPLPTEAKITYPRDGSFVEINETIFGNYQNLHDDHKIWIIVLPQTVDKYYPQKAPADIIPGEEWSSHATLGIPEDSGDKFDVIVVIANKEAQNKFYKYLDDSILIDSWKGIDEIPPGATIYDRITVIRN